MAKKKILLIASAAGSLVHFRGDLIKDLIRNNYEVYASAPEMDNIVKQKLVELGAMPIEFSLQRTGLNPIKDFISIFQLKHIISKYQINMVFPYTIKPVIYGSIAARMANVPAVSLITGLGFTFSGSSKKAKFLQSITEIMYRVGLKKNKAIIFQNSDDVELFRKRKVIDKNQQIEIVNGSGVNLERYPYRVNKNKTTRVVFLIVARLIEEKGIHLFIESAEILKKDFPNAEFHVIGSPGESPSAIKLGKLEELHKRKVIVYHGQKRNVPDFLFNSDVFVLPTYYREGIPRSILEALSVGMPIITTNTPGCKETISKGLNGVLIEPKKLDSLIDAMRYFLENPGKIEELGVNSRKLAEDKFNVDIINRRIFNILQEEE
jgi:glycosyltransferase involved in cell wall biosynthesis